MNPISTDVLIIGGGPAGTTFARLMAQRGWRVTLLEKDSHPRFHIGESLLPMNLPIFERLGIGEEVRQIGVPKLGADFTLEGCGEAYTTYHFSRALGASPDHAYEVRRSEFDQLLFEACGKSGVDTRDRTRVTDVEILPQGIHRVRAVDEAGGEHGWEARFLLDASGRDAFLSSRNRWKVRSRKHASAAVFGHFKGVQRRPGADQGNISVYWFEFGWIWMIPLREDVMSIGAVCLPEYLKSRTVSLDEFLLETLRGIPQAWQRMRGAEQLQPAQATGNFSYRSRVMDGRGFLIVGDAYAFIDPVFSSGVYLAMSGGENAVAVAESWLRGKRLGHWLRVCLFKWKARRALSAFSWFIYRFNTPAMRALFSKPRNVFKVEQAVISMLAGDAAGFGSVQLRLMAFRVIYGMIWLKNWRASWENRKIRMDSIQGSFE